MSRRRLPPLTALLALDAIARHASFTRAAEELGLTQSAVSHRIRSLEAHFGVRLIDRLNPGIALTRDGRALLPDVSAAFDLLSNLSVRALRTRPLRLGLSAAVQNWWLSERLAKLARDLPEIELDIVPFDNAQDVQRLDVDVRVSWIDADESLSGANQIPFPLETVFPVVAPSRLPDGAPISVSELACLPLIQKGADDPAAQGAEWRWSTWLPSGEQPRAAIRYREIGGALAAAAAGVGVALGRSLLVRNALADGRLIRPLDARHDRPCSKRHLVSWPRNAGDKRFARLGEWLATEAARTQ